MAELQIARRLVLSKDPDEVNHLLMFRRFRFHVIAFLRLPEDVSETELLSAIKSASLNLLASYEQRAARAKANPPTRVKRRANRD